MWVALLAPVVGLGVFLALWAKYRAHVMNLFDAIVFFFAPRGPNRMLLFKDLMGRVSVFYNYNTVKTGERYIVNAGPYVITTEHDPDEYAEPVSLIDTKAMGVANPFGLFVRQLVGLYILITLVTISFTNTAWATYTVFGKVGKSLTGIDMLVFFLLVVWFAWLISVLMRAFTPQTRLTGLVAVGASSNSLEAVPPLDTYSSVPPTHVLRAIARPPKIVVDDKAREIVEKITRQVGDQSLAASILALLATVYDTWRKSMAIMLQDRYDISVAGQARYNLAKEKVPLGRLQRWGGWLALIAIVLAVIAVGLMLGVQVEPTLEGGATTAAEPPPPPGRGMVTVSPAPPPELPTTTTTITPAPPPEPS